MSVTDNHSMEDLLYPGSYPPPIPELKELMDELDELPEFKRYTGRVPDFRKGVPSDFNDGLVFKTSDPHLLKLRAGSEEICKRGQALLSSVGVESTITPPGVAILIEDNQEVKIRVPFWRLTFEIPEGGEHIILARLRGQL